MYRVVVNFKVYPFNDYRKALEFKQRHGGQIYERITSVNVKYED